MLTEQTSTLSKVDGNGNQASFNRPQGIYFDSSSKNLIIIDFGFNSIRKMNQSGFYFYFLNIFFLESKNSQQNIQIK